MLVWRLMNSLRLVPDDLRLVLTRPETHSGPSKSFRGNMMSLKTCDLTQTSPLALDAWLESCWDKTWHLTWICLSWLGLALKKVKNKGCFMNTYGLTCAYSLGHKTWLETFIAETWNVTWTWTHPKSITRTYDLTWPKTFRKQVKPYKHLWLDMDLFFRTWDLTWDLLL